MASRPHVTRERCRAMDPPLIAYRIRVSGMTCADCARHVAALRNAGAAAAEVDHRTGRGHLSARGELDEAAVRTALQAAGYALAALERLDPGGARPSGPPAQGEQHPGGPAPGRPASVPQPGEPEVLPGPGTPEIVPRHRAPEGRYDLVVIGSGGAGMAAAIRAVEAGARVAMVERGTVGGTCVNVGCVPSKALLKAAQTYARACHHPFAGVETAAVGLDLPRVVGEKDALVERLRRQKYLDLIADYGWELVPGEARFTAPDELEVEGRRLRARAFVVATGAAPAVPPIPGLEEAGYLTSTEALSLKRRPARVAVIGAGYVALELGQYFRHLGSEVVLIQRGPRFLHRFEPEVAAAVADMLRAEGIEWVTGARVERVEHTAAGRRLVVSVGGERRDLEAEEILVAAGRAPRTGALRLDCAGVAVGPRGEVQVDARQRTANPRVFAAGDVTLGRQFVYVAAHQGSVAAENALGLSDRSTDLTVVPWVIFTRPAIAGVGLSEAEARARGLAVRTAVLPLEAVPRARVDREDRGVFKLVAEAGSGRLLGAQVAAEGAGEVIYAATLAVRFGLTLRDLQDTLCPYLTMAEGLRLAAQAFDRDVSRLSCCAT